MGCELVGPFSFGFLLQLHIQQQNTPIDGGKGCGISFSAKV